MLTSLAFYKALADEIRLKSLLLILEEGELCVCELLQALNQDSQPKVSRHLAQLKKLGMLRDRKQQQWVFYSINPKLADWMLAVLQQTKLHDPTLIQLELQRLNSMGERPVRMVACCS